MYKIMILSATVLMGGYAALRTSQATPTHTVATEGDSVKNYLPVSAIDFSSWRLLPAASEIQWKAAYITGGGHNGTLHVKEGGVRTGSDRMITNGRFVLDMNSIQATDQPDKEGRKDLEAHLKSADFFATEKFPLAYFTVTGSSPYASWVQGNLTIKGVSHPVVVPFTYRVQNDTLYVQGHLNIDRTEWGINYQSEGLFSAAKDGIIKNSVELNLLLRFYRIKDHC